MLRILVALVPFVLGLTASQAHAENALPQCSAMLDEVTQARESLEQLEASLASIDAERAELVASIDRLQRQIDAARHRGEGTLGLQGERDALRGELALVDELRPTVVAQLEALRASVDATERGYIACVEATI
ncbi:MAG: hypothetical protein U0168_03685 [Nannocystaceae bacterium]